MLRNPEHGFGWVGITLHWVTAIAVLVLFPLGLYMTDLSYMDPLYRTLPFVHRSIGVLLFMVVSLRLVWRIANPQPRPLSTHAAWERRLASLTHSALYALLFAVMVTGYLMSTADGRPISVFGWFQMPATITSIPGHEDVAVDLHFILAITLVSLVSLVVLHVAGALKHHFIDRDTTLWRIVRPGAKTSSSES